MTHKESQFQSLGQESLLKEKWKSLLSYYKSDK